MKPFQISAVICLAAARYQPEWERTENPHYETRGFWDSCTHHTDCSDNKSGSVIDRICVASMWEH